MQDIRLDIVAPPMVSSTIIGFEGPEKKFEIDFRHNNLDSPSSPKGFRSLNREQWQERVLNYARCTIISVTSDEFFDSYVLSESSLFVYPTKVMLKTCGTTTLLNAVAPIMDIAQELDLSVLHVYFARKNFNFPEVQPAPHRSFEEECVLLNKFFDGCNYIIGPMNGDHWHLYHADYSHMVATELHSKIYKPEATLEIMMHDLCPKRMKQFYKNPETFKNSMDTTEKSGIADLLPGSSIDAFQFDPCGYSMNGLFKEGYWTIHITPEPHCSYVSFETNVAPSLYQKDTQEFYSWLVEKVLKAFKPGRATLTLFADDSLVCEKRKTASCFDETITKLNLNKSKYKLKNKSMYEFDGCSLTLVNLLRTSRGYPATPSTPKSPRSPSALAPQSLFFPTISTTTQQQ